MPDKERDWPVVAGQLAGRLWMDMGCPVDPAASMTEEEEALCDEREPKGRCLECWFEWAEREALKT